MIWTAIAVWAGFACLVGFSIIRFFVLMENPPAVDRKAREVDHDLSVRDISLALAYVTALQEMDYRMRDPREVPETARVAHTQAIRDSVQRHYRFLREEPPEAVVDRWMLLPSQLTQTVGWMLHIADLEKGHTQ